jgi:uncharacterized iron-regulated protein
MIPSLTFAILGLALPIPQQAPPDPLNLDIGRAGKANVSIEEILDLRSGTRSTVADIAAAADGHRFVYLGESHDRLAHHKMQADVIEALVKRGRDVVVGFEMFTRPVQKQLNPWTLGWWSEEEFVKKADWKGQWGFDFALYRPIFEVTRIHKLPMVALNVPRDWVRRVGKDGLKSLTAEEQAQVPKVDTTNQFHRAIFGAMMGGHPPTGDRGENIYSAQCLWDTGMADSALKYLDAMPYSSKTVFVVVAGSGHVMYNQAINWRIEKRTGERGITVMMAESDKPISVSRGIGDFVYVSKP